MKKISISLLFVMVFFLYFTFPVHAAGSGNVDGGGGSLNQGSKAYNWPTNGHQGVRITVVETKSGTVVGGPVDFSNRDLSDITGAMIHFGLVSKLQYRNGAAITPQMSDYVCYKPDNPIPQIISTNSSKASIEQIKRYFCSEGAASMVAEKVGMDMETMTNGSYKMIIEPVVYLIYENVYFAMTATEAGLYNQITGGGLGAHFPSLVLTNLPLSLFLEKDDLGFSAYTGPKNTKRTTEEIIQMLGIGIISYKEAPPTETEYDVTYRVDTDVITSTTLTTTEEINNKNRATITFTMGGKSYQMTGVVVPKNGSQVVWVKWHTPSEPCEITITISTNRGRLSTTTIRANVVDLDENPPPDPMADDRNDGYTRPGLPTGQNVTSLTWSVWRCWWEEDWVWKPNWEQDNGEHKEDCPEDCSSTHTGWIDNGKWEDEGEYVYERDIYSASLSATMNMVPDEKNPTAAGNTLKSGYGVNLTVNAQMSSAAPNGHLTQSQTAVTYFPEFDYKDYWRLLERTSPGYSAIFQFKQNEYSTYNRRTHFTPVWFPDGNYTVYTEIYDAWTPAGMLKLHLKDTLTIQDNLFSDWHIRPLN